MRPDPDRAVLDWVAGQSAANLYLSTVNEAELRHGMEVMPSGARRDRLLAGVEGMIRADFAGRILSFDSAAAEAYALVGASRHADCQIAAIARSHGAAVATGDADGFLGSGMEVIDPWAGG